MRDYNPDIAPPETYELPGAFAARLATSAAIQGLLGDPTPTIHADEFPDRLTGEGKARVLVREPWIGSQQEDSIKSRFPPVEVVVEATQAGGAGWKPRLVMSAIHAAAYIRLVGWSPALQYASVHLPVQRSNAPNRAVYHEETDTLTSIAIYRITLLPVDPPPEEE